MAWSRTTLIRREANDVLKISDFRNRFYFGDAEVRRDTEELRGRAPPTAHSHLPLVIASRLRKPHLITGN